MNTKLKLMMILGIGLMSSNAYAQTHAAKAQKALSNKVTSSGQNAALNNDMDKLSYTLGVELGKQLKGQNITVNPQAVMAGLRDYSSNKKLALSVQDMQQQLINVQQQVITRHETELKSVAIKNDQDGRTFLSQNRSQPGVKSLPNGLQYKIIQDGTGVSPSDSDVVTVNYVGKSLDGTIFDSSIQRNKPATFALSDVIPGWQEALKMMKEGSTWEIYVPANLAYGNQGMGNVIGPDETLIFKINLISVQKKT